MTSLKRMVAACLSVGALAACANVDPTDAEDLGAQNDSLFPATGTLWQERNIPVCWENPGSYGVQRGWVRDQVTKAWDAASSINFTGWDTCNGATSGIRIFIDDSGPHTKGLGTQIKGVAQGMVLNFTFRNWSQACQGQEEFCIRSIAVHEFGHAIGFAHEQNRKDRPSTCTSEPQGGDGDLVVGSWDLSSVMNYCNPQYNGNGNLSQSDIDGVRLAYDIGLSGLIFNKNSNKCIDVTDWSLNDGAAVVAWPCHGGNNQRWNFRQRSDGYYEIVNRNSGKCLDVRDVSTASGAVIQQWACAGSDNQAWAIESSGATRLRAKHSGKCIDVSGGSQANGAAIVQWDCHGYNQDYWYLK